jgi:ATP-dependent RNA helicase DOB1
MKIEDTDPEFIIRRSFHQFEKDLTLPDIQSEKVKLQERVQDLQVSSETEISKIYSCEAEIERCNVS